LNLAQIITVDLDYFDNFMNLETNLQKGKYFPRACILKK
jgi:hypothetical protein